MARVAPINEALGRFFPGGPIPNRPRKPYGSRKPIQFKDFDAYYEEFFDMINKDANIGDFLKNYVVDELKADFNQSMEASVKAPSDASAAKIPEEFAGDLEELPGAVGVAVNLNPVDWAKKPGKEGKKLLSSIIKGTFGFDIDKKTWDFSDVDKDIEKNFIWDPLVKGERIGKSRLTKSLDKQNVFARILEKGLTGKEPAFAPTVPSTNTGFSKDVAKELLDYKSNKDAYIIGKGFVSAATSPVGDAQKAFVDGMIKFSSSGDREDSFTSIGTNFLKVLDSECRNTDAREIQYNVLDADTYALLKHRMKDISGNNTRVIDPFGNDFLSMTSGTLQGYVEERTDIQTHLIAKLEKRVDNYSKKIQFKENKQDLRKAQKDLDSAKKRLGALDGKIQSAITQLVADKPGSFGAINAVVDAIEASGSTDAQIKKLSSTLGVFGDTTIGLTQHVASLRHALFEQDNITNVKLPGLQADKAKLEKELAALKVSPTDPKAIALIKKIGKIDDTITKSASRLVKLGTEIPPLANSLGIAGGAIDQAIIRLQTIGADPALITELLDNVGSSTALHTLEKVTALEAKITGTIESTIDETRKSLKERAVVTDGSMAFREQYEFLNGMHDFYGSFKDISGELPKGNIRAGDVEFDDHIKALREACSDQLDAYNEAKALFSGKAAIASLGLTPAEATALLEKNKAALDEFESLFNAHIKAVEKLQKEASSINSTDGIKSLLRKYKSVYDTATIGGGIGDATTRKFMESVYFKDGPLADSFRGAGSSDTFENSKRLYILARFRYEKSKATDIYKMIKGGPKGLINPLMQEFIKEGKLKYVAEFYHKLSRPKDMIMDYILEPTHFFGLIYDEKKAKEFKKYGGIQGWVESHIGEPLAKLIGVNELNIKLEGLAAFSMIGGEHLKGAVALGDMISGLQKAFEGGTGGVPTDVLNALFKAGNIKDLDTFDILKGVKISKEGVGDINDFLGDIQKLKAWLLTNKDIASKLGISFDPDDNIILSEMALKFFSFIKKLSADPSSTDPTAFLVGRLKLLSQTLSRIQTGYIALIANIRKPVVYLKTLISEGLTTAIMAYLDSATGMLAEGLRVAVRFIVNVVVDWGEKLITGIMKFDLTEFMDEVTGFISGGIKYSMYFVLAPIIVFFMLFNSMDTLILGISPVDNSRTNGVLLTGCGPIDERAQGVGSCGICDASDTVDWSPYDMSGGKSAFTEGIAFVLNAAAKDFNIPAPALGAIFYVEGWSENVDGKFSEAAWNKENVCDWSLNEGPLLPGCEDRTSSSDARGSFQWIPGWFNPQIEASGVASKTPLPRGEYDPCNFLDAAYASAGRFAELGAAVGAGACGGGWLAPIGSSRPSGYADGLPASAPKVQFAILHYACGANGSECFSENFLDYSRKGLAVFNALKCF